MHQYKKYIMKELIKNSGLIVVLLAVVVLALYAFNVLPVLSNPNLFLIVAAVMLVVGFCLHIFLNRRIE